MLFLHSALETFENGAYHESLGRLLHEPHFSAEIASKGWRPAADVAETDKEFTITADLPDVDREQIEVKVDGNLLSITGTRESETTEDEGEFHRRERSFGKFSRSFGLPESVDVDNISAEHNNGVLKVHIPKIEPKKKEAKRVAVG